MHQNPNILNEYLSILNSKLASLFKLNADAGAGSNESLKYKAPKQPQQQAQQQNATTSSSGGSQQQSVMFFSNVQAFK